MQQVIPVVTLLQASPYRHHQFMKYLEAAKAAWAVAVYFYAVRWGNLTMRFMEVLPQIRDFWELQDQEAQHFGVLAVHTMMLSYSCDKTWKYIELEIQEKKKGKEHDYTFRNAIAYFKTGQITFEECNHHTIK